MSPATVAIHNPRAFAASAYQQRFFTWVANGKGSAILKAVAGSGKSTSIVRALEFIPATAQVIIFAFNSPIAKEMREKIKTFGAEIGLSFANVEAVTFHSKGFRALCKRWGRDVKVDVDDGKVRKILKDRLSETEYEMYGDFVSKLVGYAKGTGIGIAGLGADVDDASAWAAIIATQDMWFDDGLATEARAIEIAQKALKASNARAERDRWIDFNDQLYLPLLWNFRLFQHDWVFVDEAQDTNPVRREFARRSLKPAKAGGRLVAVGDPRQSIYAFTGASSNALDVIAAEFETVELPLTVSYRCPKAVGRIVREIVEYFEVAPGAIEGSVQTLSAKDALAKLGPADAILCRKTAPLVALAFRLIAQNRGCRVLGRDIGAGLVALVKKLRARGVDNLIERLDAYLEKETAAFAAAGQCSKAEALADRVAAIKVVAESVTERTVPGVIAMIEELFAEDGRPVLTLATGHKAKGREWRRVAIWEPELIPVRSAKTEEAYQQEMNLDYVMKTRSTEDLYLVPGEARI